MFLKRCLVRESHERLLKNMLKPSNHLANQGNWLLKEEAALSFQRRLLHRHQSCAIRSMAINKYFRTRSNRLGMAQQHLRMTLLHPNFRLLTLTPKLVTWQGSVKPLPLSESYLVRLRYEKYKGPQVSIISPKLRLCDGALSIPHTYIGDYLCLYYPDYKEWTSAKYVAETIVPWISLWLMYYEAWLATGEWLGGGIKHQREEKGAN